MESPKSYEAANVVEYSLKDKIRLNLKAWYVFYAAIIISVPGLLRWIKELIIPPKPKNVSGQLALVTGGSNGIGKSIAMRLAQSGCNIAIANRNLTEGEKAATEIREKYGVKAKAFKVDVSKHDEVAELKEDVERSLGNVDILVNNAGFLPFNISVLEGTPQDIQQIIDTNLTSYFWTVRQFLPGMIVRKRGHILAISSLLAKVTSFNSVAYATTKFGNDGFMSALYDDLCYHEQDEFIKLSTAYPAFVGTQKKLVELVQIWSDVPIFGPDYIGDLIVRGMLANRREFIVPSSSGLVLLFKLVSDKALKWAKLSYVDMSKKNLFEQMRKTY